MARMTLEQIKACRPAANRRKIEATTEEDIARHMVEDGEMPSAPDSAGRTTFRR
jgi:putative transcriptional regulator